MGQGEVWGVGGVPVERNRRPPREACALGSLLGPLGSAQNATRCGKRVNIPNGTHSKSRPLGTGTHGSTEKKAPRVIGRQ